MAFIPQSSMPLPTWFLRQTATITTQTSTQDDTGQWYHSGSTTYTCLCNLQPISSSESTIYRKETTTTLYNLFLSPTCTDGTSAASIIDNVTTFTIDNVVYKMAGEGLDLCSNSVVLQCGVYREA